MHDKDTLYWIWLSLHCGDASREFRLLIERIDSPFDIYRLEDDELLGLHEVGHVLRDRLADKSLERAYAILSFCKREGIDIVTYGDRRYPKRLRTLEDPPVLLYCAGTFPDLNSRLCVGIVGTRSISEYGRQSAYTISYELAAAEVCVISGMALGVDAVAHAGALEAGGLTVAVLGCGIDVLYPRAHKALRRAIREYGAIVTEYPPGEEPHGYHFPKRNRLISGLSQGVLVIEGNLSSGAMITASRAIAQGRDVFALPGKVNESNSDGPNELIRNGANVALGAEDILMHYDFLYRNVINYRSLRRAKRNAGLTEEALLRYGLAYGKTEKRQTPKQTAEQAVDTPSGVSKKEESVTEREASDASAAILASLDETSRRVYGAMPTDHAVAPDAFSDEGIGIADAVTALTMLELNGLVQSLPGGLYLRS
ncbi:MAG: DNA-protecting protein DprA [Ruminococcaceae bacterium]|nr:DNA-protecting protein DprA [Oscillospiraceae bacterium]